MILNSQSSVAVSFLLSCSQFLSWDSFWELMFCSISVLGLVSDSRSHLLECKNIHTAHTASNVHTASCVYPSRTPQQSDLAVYLVNSMEMYGQASLGIQLADDRFLSVSNTRQRSQAGTQQCARMLISVRHTRSIPRVLRVYTFVLRVSYWQYHTGGMSSMTMTKKCWPHWHYIRSTSLQNISNTGIMLPECCEYRQYPRYRTPKYSGLQAV